MSAKNKKAAASAASKRTEDGPKPTPPAASPTIESAATGEAVTPFAQRHPKIANAIFAGLCVYVAMIWLLALDQTFHWGIFGPKLPLTP